MREGVGGEGGDVGDVGDVGGVVAAGVAGEPEVDEDVGDGSEYII